VVVFCFFYIVGRMCNTGTSVPVGIIACVRCRSCRGDLSERPFPGWIRDLVAIRLVCQSASFGLPVASSCLSVHLQYLIVVPHASCSWARDAFFTDTQSRANGWIGEVVS